MRHLAFTAVFSLAILGQHCVHNILNLPFIIEETLRDYRRHSANTDESHFKQRPLLAEYDFIVVGAGPGGATVANRLSENPEWNVLLLEAGKEESIILDIPVIVSYMQFTDYNWGYEAEPQPGACLGIKDGRCRWPRGKGLGGTSSINYMIYTRGNKLDYDQWAEQGNVGWSHKEVLPYFLKSEDCRIPELKDNGHHKQGGYLPVEHLRHRTPLGTAFLEAGKEMGFDIIDYNNGESPLGFAPVQEMMDRGHRSSSSKAFLRPVKNRDNLQISTNSRVTKVLIDPTTKTAEGVQVVRNRKTYTVKARKEVILSAGSLNSPQLLMLSGVGPKSHLEELGIPVIQNLPVGENLQEHVSYCGLTFLVNESYTGILEQRLYNAKYLYQFLENGTGPLVVPGGVEGLAYINTKLNDDSRGRPDIELIFGSGSLTSDDGKTVRGGIGVTDEIYQETFRPVEGRDNWTVWPMILHPKSKGYMRLKSRNPWHWPKFYANYFQNQQDLDTIVEGIKFVLKMSQTNAFQKYGSYLNHLPLKACLTWNQGSDDYWRCAIRQLTTTLHHQSGTCKMGPASDPSAVVSPELKVHGINNLRVIDASIIPQLTTAHTTAPTYMIGEKGADMVKATWQRGVPELAHPPHAESTYQPCHRPQAPKPESPQFTGYPHSSSSPTTPEVNFPGYPPIAGVKPQPELPEYSSLKPQPPTKDPDAPSFVYGSEYPPNAGQEPRPVPVPGPIIYPEENMISNGFPSDSNYG